MRKNKMKRKKSKAAFSGVFTALITPFYRGRVDFISLKKLVRDQIDGGTEGFVINGTTGESPTLEESEVEKIFYQVRKETDDTVPLVLGTGSNSTAATVYKTKMAKKWGADGALVVVPYYNKPPQRGLVAHYKQVAEASTIPVLLYNVPGRTVVSLSEETIVALSKIKNIVGVKEASGQIELVERLAKQVRDDFLLISGDDSSCIDFMLAGGHGVISVVSHIIPGKLRDLSDRARRGDSSVREEYGQYDKLNSLMGVESNPIPVKMALYIMGIIRSPELRLPLVPLSKEHTARVKSELKKLRLF